MNYFVYHNYRGANGYLIESAYMDGRIWKGDLKTALKNFTKENGVTFSKNRWYYHEGDLSGIIEIEASSIKQFAATIEEKYKHK